MRQQPICGSMARFKGCVPRPLCAWVSNLIDRHRPLPRARSERRNGPDFMSRFGSWCVATGWLFTLAGILLWLSARPDEPTMFDRFLGNDPPAHWDTGRVELAFPLMIMGLLSCLLAFATASARMKRRNDRHAASLILLCVTTSMGLIAHLLFTSVLRP